jgi:UDP-N-acetylmuramate dehydrogenase
VIALGRAFNHLEITAAGQVKVDAGVPCAKVARFSARAGYTGAEFLAGIPGTMGGALAMNAGAFGGETWNIVSSVKTLSRTGNITTRVPADFNIGYRSVQIPSNEWFISAALQLQKDHEKTAGQRIRELLEKRSATQPVGLPSCGSVFRNPTGDYAARLIDACGLKGKRIGDAAISEKHANFIINHGNATARDIEGLVGLAKQKVLEKFGIELTPEVRIVGVAQD